MLSDKNPKNAIRKGPSPAAMRNEARRIRRVTRNFHPADLKRICEMRETEFGPAYDMERVETMSRYSGEDYYFFKDNGADILAVAHLDTVVPHKDRTCVFAHTMAGPVVHSGALDDRLGAYIILELLPALGINCDILLTVGEEMGQSTAEFFDPGERAYNWMIEFDRGGTDVVMYQYDDEETRDLVHACGARSASGAFSDISYLEHLEIKGFNWGVGYQDYHSVRGYAYLEDTISMVAKYLKFHKANALTYLPHEKTSMASWWGGFSRSSTEGHHHGGLLPWEDEQDEQTRLFDEYEARMDEGLARTKGREPLAEVVGRDRPLDEREQEIIDALNEPEFVADPSQDQIREALEEDPDYRRSMN